MYADVVVAGVGIAGAFALRALSRKLKAIGIDKRQKLGYPVECGEIIPTKEEMKKLLPNLDSYSLFDIPKRFENNRTKEFKFILPNGKTFSIDFEMHIVRRDELIESVAMSSKHEIWLNARIMDFKEGEIILGDGRSLKPEVVVASDGANSKVAKKLGLLRHELVPAKQYLMKGVECDEETIYMYVGKDIAAGGYAWIIPKGKGYANVGVGFRKEFANPSDNIHKALNRFVEEYPYSSIFLKNAEIIDKIGAFVPASLPSIKAVYGNVLFAGDSASMIISHVGAGIPTSMVAGDIAGKVINEYFEGGKLEKYDVLWRDAMLDVMQRSYFIKTLWDRISDSDERIAKYFRLISNRDMELILRSKIPYKLRIASALLPLLNTIFRF
jgi:geranylgeranyl reductase family protein